MIVPVILGLDPGTRRLGWGAVHAETGAAIDCDSVRIGPAPGVRVVDWTCGHELYPRAVREAIRASVPTSPYEVVGLAVERMVGGRMGITELITLADAAGQIVQAASRIYRVPVLRLAPHEWKRAVGLKGNCKATEAVPRASELGFTVPNGDAASGACLARAAWALLEAVAA